MENIFNLYSAMKEKNNHGTADIPNFNEIEVKDLIINNINLDELISVKSKYNNIEFNHISLYSAYFVQTSFKKCIFQNVDFTKSNLNNTIFESCSFISCSFASAEIMGAEITKCNFKKCIFTDIIFSDNKICDTNFEIIDKSFSAIDNNIEENVVWIFD